MNFRTSDFINSLFIRSKPVYKEPNKDTVFTGSGSSPTYTKATIKKEKTTCEIFSFNFIAFYFLGFIQDTISKKLFDLFYIFDSFGKDWSGISREFRGKEK